MRVRFPIQKSADSIKCIESKNLTQKIKVCVAGKNEIALNALKLLQTRFQNDEICVIPNRNDVGIDRWQPSLLKYALQASIPVCTLEQVQQIANVLFYRLNLIGCLRWSSLQVSGFIISTFLPYQSIRAFIPLLRRF